MAIVILILFLSSFAADSAELKTYIRDIDTSELEDIRLELRGSELYSNFKESKYGEYIYITHRNKKQRIEMSDQGMGRYRFFPGSGLDFSKTFANKVSEDTLAIYLLKDNRPFPDKLSIILFSLKSSEVMHIVTDFNASEGKIENTIFYFKAPSDNCDPSISSIDIEGEKYITVKKEIGPWYSFDGRSIVVNEDITYDQFEYKQLYPQKSDFLRDLALPNDQFTVAINHVLKRTCLSFGDQQWRCVTAK